MKNWIICRKNIQDLSFRFWWLLKIFEHIPSNPLQNQIEQVVRMFSTESNLIWYSMDVGFATHRRCFVNVRETCCVPEKADFEAKATRATGDSGTWRPVTATDRRTAPITLQEIATTTGMFQLSFASFALCKSEMCIRMSKESIKWTCPATWRSPITSRDSGSVKFWWICPYYTFFCGNFEWENSVNTHRMIERLIFIPPFNEIRFTAFSISRPYITFGVIRSFVV